MGSSPLTRGTPNTPVSSASSPGIIPAYTGNTPPRLCGWSSEADHPRLRGEHFSLLFPSDFRIGSSPLMRGTRQHSTVSSPSPRIIPAYAGNTRHNAITQSRNRDHPRLRGEHSIPSEMYSLEEGSSPLTRGTLHQGVVRDGLVGIILAYAGNTRRTIPPVPRPWDHPRLRGEHSR